MISTHVEKVEYRDDAAGLFQFLGATVRDDSVLLEGADIASKKKTTCLAIIRGAARVTCSGPRVSIEALSDIGCHIIDDLAVQLSDYRCEHSSDLLVVEFPPSNEIDERARLLAINNTHVLRLLALHASYSGQILPFLAGGFAFDLLETFEELPPVAMGHNSYPDYQFLVAEEILRINHRERTADIEVLGLSAEAATQRALQLKEQISHAPQHFPSDVPPVGEEEPLQARADLSDSVFCAHIARLKEAIYSGDIYQVVPARTFTLECPDAFAAYKVLRETNPSPYMFYVRGKESAAGESFELFGASPESNLTFDHRSREVQLYPIAGTRPRGLNSDGSINEELDIRQELVMRTDAKEIAEHIMLVDLARNDLARVSIPATRRVDELLHVDRYSRVMHLVSRVTATLHPEVDALDAYRACMNMGTLTGAPKLRAVSLLREVEQQRRGSYGGALGYVRGDGSLDSCIIIRSAFVKDGQAAVQAGAGVVRDSSPQAEADETVHKAYAVLDAIAQAAGRKLEVERS
ncbi:MULTISPECIES: anthranilate synthase component 1 [unclassified Corynebacterium]|uniref:anthranilate synthase component 1 n=1 Tax=unclassified Corynebacterium TaxID=2624378 RepID=UPI002169A166|nr:MULTISPECIES: anthranilate synthase component 1 [unclassified Corynebacterium]MCS4492262.1 anthranilate synthase component 1 [Corynebacterium sp. ES2715-CONJ3]MCS4532254.1 anthranilate synthase component 1 [Corynebacterium sp. ES2730-CONJ]